MHATSAEPLSDTSAPSDADLHGSAPGPAGPQPALDPWAWRFALSWCLPLAVAIAAAVSPARALVCVLLMQCVFVLLERVPALMRSPAASRPWAWHLWCLRVHVPLQFGLLALGCAIVGRLSLSAESVAQVLALGLAVGWITGSQGITYAHELGHRRSPLDRALAWALMGSVLYAHFMVEHYRGHHVRAATAHDPASAERGESLWRFLPRTVVGGWRSAWALERAHLLRLRRGWARSLLLWMLLAQPLGLLLLLVWGGPLVLLFWAVQAAMAVLLLEAINYVEHYGLRRAVVAGRLEPFGVQHAWNADHLLTNCVLANLQRHSDHHLHPSRPYEALQPLQGPQLPTGYAGCVLLALVPPLWFRLMHRRMPS